METITELYKLTQESALANMGYDLFKIILGFVVARYLVDGLYMKKRWGGWKFLVMDREDVKVERIISSAVAKRILTDETDFSVYTKGVVSPFAWLNVDLASKSALDIGLLERNRKEKKIVIHLDKNPSQEKKKKQPSNAEVLEKIDSLEKSVLEWINVAK